MTATTTSGSATATPYRTIERSADNRVSKLPAQRDPVHLPGGRRAGDVVDDHKLPGMLVRCQPAGAMGSQLGQIRRGRAIAENQCHADDLAPVWVWPTGHRE